MEWNDEAIILSARPHGETATIVTLITPEYGRFAGLLPGGQSQKAQPLLQPGNVVKAKWRARIAEQLGTFTLDLITCHAARWLDNREILGIIASAVATTEASLPERQPMQGVYAGLSALLSLDDPDLWGPAYVKWEMGLLRALGYGLDLRQCAASGDTENLVYVSPRTGRAVSREIGAAYHDKLFPLPSFLLGPSAWDNDDIHQGLELTAHFLSRHVFAHPHSRLLIPMPGDLPMARQRLAHYYHTLCQATVETEKETGVG